MIAAEGHLQIAILVELVDRHVGNLAALQLEDNAETVFVRFVADVGDARQYFVID